MMEIKHRYFIDVVSIIPCQNSMWIIGSTIYGVVKTQISLSLSTVIDPLAQDPEQERSLLI